MQVDDLYTFVGIVEQRVGGRLPAASTFLGGQSMGGLVAALGALRCQERWAGLVVFSGAMGVVWTLVLRCGKCTWMLVHAALPLVGVYTMQMLLVHTCCSHKRQGTVTVENNPPHC